MAGVIFAVSLLQHPAVRFVPQYLIFGVGFCALTLALYFYPTRLLVNDLTIWLGKTSFSIYLVHFAVIEWAKNIFTGNYVATGDLGFVLTTLFVLCVSGMFAMVTYRLVELPGIAAGRRLIDRLELAATRRQANAPPS